MTSVPRPTFGATGFVGPTDAAILAGVQTDINDAFGGGLNPALETPQGQLATSETAVISNTYDTFCFYAQQVDPAFAIGRMQDAIARIYFIERLPALPTLADCVCSGLTGVIIPAGSLALAADGSLYAAEESGTIGAGGTVTITFANTTLGPIPCVAGSVNSIYRAIPGWDSITNPTDGTLGRNVESRAEFEARRQQSVAKNAVGSLPALHGAVHAVDGVVDAFVYENPGNTPLTYRGYTLAPHSIYVAVLGGTDLDVATAIWKKKAPGAAYNGNTTVAVQDTSEGYSPPYPTYNVTFQRPTSTPILIAVTVVNSPQVPSDAETQIKAALIAAFAGADGGPSAKIGDTLYATRYVGPVVALGTWAIIQSILLGSGNSLSASFMASITGLVMTVSSVASGTLAVGQTVRGTGVLSGTRILTLGSGAGGTGTYNLNKTQTVGSEAMTSMVASASSAVLNIDQVPTITSDDITVAFV